MFSSIKHYGALFFIPFVVQLVPVVFNNCYQISFFEKKRSNNDCFLVSFFVYDVQDRILVVISENSMMKIAKN
ncbi:MAG: hypothetical protein DRN08_03735 [Thermoplasmata archaeon]|nr:MAG: hypothetical protein DRN08_03735 [Thermoplasmata archaeon]